MRHDHKNIWVKKETLYKFLNLKTQKQAEEFFVANGPLFFSFPSKATTPEAKAVLKTNTTLCMRQANLILDAKEKMLTALGIAVKAGLPYDYDAISPHILGYHTLLEDVAITSKGTDLGWRIGAVWAPELNGQYRAWLASDTPFTSEPAPYTGNKPYSGFYSILRSRECNNPGDRRAVLAALFRQIVTVHLKDARPVFTQRGIRAGNTCSLISALWLQLALVLEEQMAEYNSQSLI